MKNIILDFDSTIVTIEGIDELAREKGVYDQVKQLTDQAMNGEIGLDQVFAHRLELIKPTVADLDQLGQLYLRHLTPDVEAFIAELGQRFNVFVVTGGYDRAIYPTTQKLGLPDYRVYANTLLFDEAGKYLGFDTSNPLWQANGKAIVVQHIQATHPHKTIIIGDAMSDAAAKTNGEVFVQFTGVVNRSAVAAKAQAIIDTLNVKHLEHVLY